MSMSGIDTLGECVLGHGTPHSTGYCRVTVANKTYLHHRLVWMLAYGEIPKGYQVHHYCRNKACVNIDHLKLLSASAHKRLHIEEDGLRGITAKFAAQTTCINGHLFSKSNGQRRICLKCHSARSGQYNKRNRDKINARRRELRATGKI